jgi:mono/diheme cytochrome c family protein/rhodanese-related sulfurtransferase
MLRVTAIALSVLVVTAGVATSRVDTPQVSVGAALYAQYCKQCHGADRQGYAADNAPSLASPTFLETASDAFLQAAIERGRAGTAMAGYGTELGGPLVRAEADAIIAYIRGGTAPAPSRAGASTGKAANGGVLYATHCERCHGTVEQRGNAVHLANPMFLDSATDGFLRVAITRGRPGTAMEAWRGKLSAAEIEDVIAYVRSLARPVPPGPDSGNGGNAVSRIENVPIVIHPTGAAAELTPRAGRYVSVADVAKAYAENRRLVIVDVRPTSDYRRMHIAGAISIPYYDLRALDRIPNDGTWVITYCGCPHHLSGIVVDELRKRGYAHSAVLDEGVFVWQRHGHPMFVIPGQLPIAAPPTGGVPRAPVGR